MFGLRVERAIRVALEAHGEQVRKGNGAPYVVHPVHVALHLARLGASEDVVLAGLLHDVVEDSEDWTSERVAEEFGAPVAALVIEVTEDKSKSWGERKRHAVESIPTLSEGALLVKACDKLHNLQSLGRDLAARGPEATWAGFRGGALRTQEMAQAMVDGLTARLEGPLAGALRSALRDVLDS